MTTLVFLLMIFFGVEADRLLLLQSVWRHGDRSPTGTYPTDPNQENKWHQGWGQLSALGMEQHVNLGKKLRGIYIENNPGNLNLSSTYKNYEIYIRSSDVNRTLISAMSNMIGFYGSGGAVAGLDYPNITEWPGNFVPIAVHTVDFSYDYIGDTDAICPRRDQIWDLVKETPEWKNISQQHQPMFNNLSSITGWNVSLDNLGTIFSALFIEGIYNLTNNNISQAILPYFDEINITNDQVESFYVGLDLAPYNGIDFSIELPKLRGGSLLWALIGNMRTKYDCYTGKLSNTNICDNWINKLKYYVWSFHDTTLSSLFATLGFKRSNFNEDGYPMYSSCATFELWVRDDNSTYIRVYYLPLMGTSNHSLEVTPEISGCENNCTLEIFEQRSKIFQPNVDGNTKDLCNKPLFSNNVARISSHNFFIPILYLIIAVLFY